MTSSRQKLAEAVAQIFSVDSPPLDAHFTDEYNADALDMMELHAFIKQEFDVDIPDKDKEKLNTLDDYVEYIDQRTS